MAKKSDIILKPVKKVPKHLPRQVFKAFTEPEAEKEVSLILRDALRQTSPQIFKALTSGTTREEMIKQISEIINRASGFSATFVDTGLSVIGRQRIADTAKDLGLTWFRYIGGTIGTSRDFCIERDGGYFTQQEIEEWGELAQTDPWNGVIDGTNSENIFSFCGGWNCRHDLVPVAAFMVPKDVAAYNAEQREEAKATADRLEEIKKLNEEFIGIRGSITLENFDEKQKRSTEIANRLRELGNL